MGVGVGVDVGVGVGVAVDVGDGDGVDVGVGSAVDSDSVGFVEASDIEEDDEESVGVSVAVGDAVAVDVLVGVESRAPFPAGVDEEFESPVPPLDWLSWATAPPPVAVGVGVGVGVDVAGGTPPPLSAWVPPSGPVVSSEASKPRGTSPNPNTVPARRRATIPTTRGRTVSDRRRPPDSCGAEASAAGSSPPPAFPPLTGFLSVSNGGGAWSWVPAPVSPPDQSSSPYPLYPSSSP